MVGLGHTRVSLLVYQRVRTHLGSQPWPPRSGQGQVEGIRYFFSRKNCELAVAGA